MTLRSALLLVGAFAVGCVDNPDTTVDLATAPLLADLTIVTGVAPSASVLLAADDMAVAVAEITGATPEIVETSAEAQSDTVLQVAIDPELAGQSFAIEPRAFGARKGLLVTGADGVAAMYGIYTVVADMGVRYFHPESTFFPDDEDAPLPWSYDGAPSAPQFAYRGFHEHTQHPTPPSDFYLRPEPEFRPYASNYLAWLARNRQNMASFHMLKTVDIEAWQPYITDIVDEGHAYGIEMGLVASFVDQQQNNYRILVDETESEEEAQIHASLQLFHDIGFDFVTFQIASTEFTKPADDAVLRWIQTAQEFAGGLDPELDLHTWVHISCELLADDGSIFWHLPGRGDPDVGAWVHTVMYHDLRHPAPVYDCEDFQHQKEFIEEEDGERELTYFPESAWWLGFDNNMPLALPITGWTRAWDINEELAGHDVAGHVTFTTGREWAYWQYDHFLTRATWETGLEWRDYLEWLQPAFGENGAALVDVLDRFAERQVRDFFETNPLIYFYVAGELRQDEIGAQAGILARRPKIAFPTVVRYDDEEFAAWYADDYELLLEMRDAYADIFDVLEPPDVPDGSNLADVLYFESYSVLQLFVMRIEHALALYGAVIDVRDWVAARENGAVEGDEDHARLLAAAQAKLDEAKSITDAAHDIILANEAFYRYPTSILTEEKPDSLTLYKFGYLEETHTAHFWTRRDDQLEDLIDARFFERPDEWIDEPADLYYAEGDAITLAEPDSAVAEQAIVSFIPRMLVGIDEGSLVLGQDHNENFVPDRGTEVSMPAEVTGGVRTGSTDVYTFVVRNSTGEVLGDGLSVFDPVLTLTGDPATTATLAGNVSSQNLVGIVVDVGGIDEEGARTLMKAVFKVPADEDLPAFLPFVFELQLTAR